MNVRRCCHLLPTTTIIFLSIILEMGSVFAFIQRLVVVPVTNKPPRHSSSNALRLELPLSSSPPPLLLHLTLLKLSNNDDDDDEENLTLDQKFQKFLDTPFFEPEKVLRENEEALETNSKSDTNNSTTEEEMTEAAATASPLYQFRLWFAALVASDYELAETLYAGLFLSFMVWVSQELLRMQMYGDKYVPFRRGGLNGGDGSNWYDYL